MPKAEDSPLEPPIQGGKSQPTPEVPKGTTGGGTKDVPGGSGKASPKLDSAKDLVKNPKEALGKKVTSKATDLAGGAVAPEVKEAVEKTRQAATAVKTVATSIQGFFAWFIPVVVDPITWIVAAVLIVAIALGVVVYAGFQVVGRTENGDGCGVPGGGTSGVQAQDTGDWIGNANSVANWLMSTNFAFLGNKPMTLNQVAGIIGNWSQESQVNPKLTQSGFIASTATNQQIIALGGAGGKAIGLAQWDGGRRTALANFAESQGKHWSDINVQLEYLKTELDGWEGANLVSGGFNDPSKSAKDLVLIFEEKFERAGIPAMDNRYAGADKFLSNYKGGGGYVGGSSGGSCITGTTVDSSDLVQLAVSMSYPSSPESKVGPGDPDGVNKAKPEYIAAKKEAQEKTSADPMPTLYASCDRFVATVIRLTRDPDLPWGDTSAQAAYLAKSPKWQQYSQRSQAQAGDIWVTRGKGHIILYLGDVNGQDTIAHASYHDRVAALGKGSYLSESMNDTGGRAYYGYHYIGG